MFLIKLKIFLFINIEIFLLIIFLNLAQKQIDAVCSNKVWLEKGMVRKLTMVSKPKIQDAKILLTSN